MNDAEDSVIVKFVFIFLIMVIIFGLVEGGMFVYAFFTSDKIECNLLWCSFSKGELVESKITTSSQCSINNVTVNCSQMPDWDKESGIDRYLQ
jgi:hypothetical protein